MFSDRACRVVARDTSELTPELDTVQEDATAGTQEVVGEEPILISQLFVQHLCQPDKFNFEF